MSISAATPPTSAALGPVQRAHALGRLADRFVHGVLAATALENRSRLQSREAALERVAAVLASAIAPPHPGAAPPRRRPTRPTRGSVERRLADKRRRAQTKRLRRADDD